MTSSLRDTFEVPDTSARRRRRLRDRIVLGAVGALLITIGGFAAEALLTSCGGPGSGVTKVDGQCVGVTDGSYIFDEAYRDVQEKIQRENKLVNDIVNDPDRGPDRAVTIALLSPMLGAEGSPFSVHEIRNLLEGAYTAQYRANHTRDFGDSDPLIRLVLANEGSHQQHWQPVVKQLVEMKNAEAPLNAVVGLGVSIVETELAAKELARAKIPTIGAITTADQLNYRDIRGFLRVSPSNRDYVASLRKYFDARAEYDPALGIGPAVVVYDTNSELRGDIFIQSLHDDLVKQMEGWITIPELSFEGELSPSDATPGGFHSTTNSICISMPQTVFFAGRKADLKAFLGSLKERSCNTHSVTVVTVDADTDVYGKNVKTLEENGIKLVYADASNPRGWIDGVAQTPDHFPAFKRWFEHFGFDLTHLYDGGAISHHDAVAAAAKAIQLVVDNQSSSGLPKAEDVLNQLLYLHTSPVPGASGTLRYSSRGEGGEESGDPLGKPIPVLEFPESAASIAASKELYVTR